MFSNNKPAYVEVLLSNILNKTHHPVQLSDLLTCSMWGSKRRGVSDGSVMILQEICNKDRERLEEINKKSGNVWQLHFSELNNTGHNAVLFRSDLWQIVETTQARYTLGSGEKGKDFDCPIAFAKWIGPPSSKSNNSKKNTMCKKSVPPAKELKGIKEHLVAAGSFHAPGGSDSRQYRRQQLEVLFACVFRTLQKVARERNATIEFFVLGDGNFQQLKSSQVPDLQKAIRTMTATDADETILHICPGVENDCDAYGGVVGSMRPDPKREHHDACIFSHLMDAEVAEDDEDGLSDFEIVRPMVASDHQPVALSFCFHHAKRPETEADLLSNHNNSSSEEEEEEQEEEGEKKTSEPKKKRGRPAKAKLQQQQEEKKKEQQQENNNNNNTTTPQQQPAAAALDRKEREKQAAIKRAQEGTVAPAFLSSGRTQTVPACESCGKKFSLFNWRHNCSFCTLSYCSDCCNQTIRESRACISCHKIHTSFRIAAQKEKQEKKQQQQESSSSSTSSLASSSPVCEPIVPIQLDDFEKKISAEPFRQTVVKEIQGYLGVKTRGAFQGMLGYSSKTTSALLAFERKQKNHAEVADKIVDLIVKEKKVDEKTLQEKLPKTLIFLKSMNAIESKEEGFDLC